jgi:hypothetical protein
MPAGLLRAVTKAMDELLAPGHESEQTGSQGDEGRSSAHEVWTDDDPDAEGQHRGAEEQDAGNREQQASVRVATVVVGPPQSPPDRL